MKIKLVLLLIGIAMMQFAAAQTVGGFWSVSEVMVGTRKMTPVAKWFKFREDGTCTGGNGWTQNSVGTWSFSEKTQELVPTNELGIKDDFGPFKVNFLGDTMKWTRQEEGMAVTVSLVQIQEMPPAPADLVKGLWALSKVENSDGDWISNFDLNRKQFILIRPDMRFRLRNPDESISQGFWHMDGHRPLLTLINYDRNVSYKEYTISFENETLIMKSNDEGGNTYRYSRTGQFPE